MFDFFKTEKKQYLNSVCVDLRYLYPSEEKWNDFISIMRKKHKNIESEIPGLLVYYHNNEYLTEKMVKALVATEFYEYNNRKKSIWNKGNNKSWGKDSTRAFPLKFDSVADAYGI